MDICAQKVPHRAFQSRSGSTPTQWTWVGLWWQTTIKVIIMSNGAMFTAWRETKDSKKWTLHPFGLMGLVNAAHLHCYCKWEKVRSSISRYQYTFWYCKEFEMRVGLDSKERWSCGWLTRNGKCYTRSITNGLITETDRPTWPYKSSTTIFNSENLTTLTTSEAYLRGRSRGHRVLGNHFK